jgi:hypothetical protein
VQHGARHTAHRSRVPVDQDTKRRPVSGLSPGDKLRVRLRCNTRSIGT